MANLFGFVDRAISGKMGVMWKPRDAG